MQITVQIWAKVEAHFRRPCEMNERGEILYRDGDFPVGYIAEGEWAGWLVDSTGDSDRLVTNLARA